MKRKFKLSTSNKIISIIGAFVYLLLTVLPFTPELWTKVSWYKDILGGLLAVLLIPLFFSWVVWFISGRKKFSANLSFYLSLILILLLVSFTQFEIVSGKIQKRIQTGGSNTAETKQQENLTNPLNAFLAQTHYDQERRKKWQKAWQALQEPWVLDLASLKNKDDYARQRKVITEYVKQSKKVRDYLLNMEQNPDNRLEKLDKIPLFTMHVQYGNSMLAILSLLEENQKKWTLYQDSVPIFREKELSDKYQELITNMLAKQNEMNTLIEQTAVKSM